ncbi:MAG: SusE domain-containing protein [Rikenellaceae bacterium]|jgi:hypothetical protein|nr:SusE domain-containing protein [Rikenellaceae bacterium]
MKRLFGPAFVLVAAIALAACVKDTKYDEQSVVPVSKLKTPNADQTEQILNTASARMYFEWEEPAPFVQSYEVVFCRNADGSGELYRCMADNNGMKPSATIAHSVISNIAALAGIAVGGSGDVYWSVLTRRGRGEAAMNGAARKLTLVRYGGVIDNVPLRLFLTGEGSEGGTDVTLAAKFFETGDGKFEVYTRLSAGDTFRFVNRNTQGDCRTFSIDPSGLLSESDEGSTVASTGVYRIRVDFNTLATSTEEISEVKYHSHNPGMTRVDVAMTYDGGGVWSIPNATIQFGDSRYSFLTTVDGATEIWGANSRDNSTPAALEGDYFNIYPRPVGTLSDDWDHTWKFMSILNGQTTRKIVVDMSGDGPCRHILDFGTMNALSVAPTAPADAAAFTLNNQAGSSVAFSWNVPSGMENGVPPVYTVIFYKNAECTQEAGRVTAAGGGASPTVDITHIQLDNLANSAGIAESDSGELYWKVLTTVVTATALSDARTLTVTRIGMPSELYLTGAGSEYGATLAGAGRMLKTAAGKFEIYATLNAGTAFGFASATAGTPDMYYLSAGLALGTASGYNVATTGQYLIKVDFTTGVGTVQRVSEVMFFMSSTPTDPVLTYQGGGVWQVNDVVAVTTASWAWGDDRFVFRVTVDGVRYKYGSSDANASIDQATKVPEGDATYWVYPRTDIISSDDSGNGYHFKLWNGYKNKSAADNMRMNIKLNLSSTATHYYTFIDYLN